MLLSTRGDPTNMTADQLPPQRGTWEDDVCSVAADSECVRERRRVLKAMIACGVVAGVQDFLSQTTEMQNKADG